MIYKNFKIIAYPRVIEASCSKCHTDLREVDSGWVSSALFCPKCESVFVLKLVKVPDSVVNSGWMTRARVRANKALEADCIDRVRAWAEGNLPSGSLEQLKSILGGTE